MTSEQNRSNRDEFPVPLGHTGMALPWVVVYIGLELRKKVLGWRMQAVSTCNALGILKRIEILIMDHSSWQKKKKKVISFLKWTVIFKFFSLPTKELVKGLFQYKTKRGKLSAFYISAMGNSWGSEKRSCSFANNFLSLYKQCHILWSSFSLQKGKLCNRARTMHAVSKFFLGMPMFL